MDLISIADFKKCGLKVARIKEVHEIEKADKLWRLVIDLGGEPREIVAGIKKFYSKESLVGKSIVVVENLTPAVIRGVQSNGMLLAAQDSAGLSLLCPDRDLPPGSSIG